jgi:hypothetical protein
VFVRVPHAVDVTNVSHADLPTGFSLAKSVTGVQLGNKGGVGISFRWRETTLAFVMCHLPARPDLIRLRKREQDYKALVRKLKLESTALSAPGTGIDFVHAHDHVFFFGDANYRVELPFDRCVACHRVCMCKGIREVGGSRRVYAAARSHAARLHNPLPPPFLPSPAALWRWSSPSSTAPSWRTTR